MSLSPYWSDGTVSLHLGDCLEVLAEMEEGSVDAVVTDPPGAVSFMGREWDSDKGGRAQWVAWLAERMAEAARCLKPGGHALVWSLPRTSHWTAWALEDAGFEIRDCIPHLFGSGFPKSLDVSKAIDKAAGAEREVVGKRTDGRYAYEFSESASRAGGIMGAPAVQESRGQITAPATEDAARWEGWGTALKPGQEMWWLARKPLNGTVAANVLEHGTGALNIGGCLVRHASAADLAASQAKNPGRGDTATSDVYGADRPQQSVNDGGRWPTNLVLTHSAACEPAGTREVRSDGHHPAARGPGGLGTSGHAGQEGLGERKSGTETVQAWRCVPDCPVGELDRQSGASTSPGTYARSTVVENHIYGASNDRPVQHGHGDSGGASRFYPTFRYQAKAPASERPRDKDGNAHPTVKPVPLLSYFARLICPPGGTILDLFAGSGSMAEACIVEGFKCILIEKERPSAELIRIRLRKDIQPVMFGEETA